MGESEGYTIITKGKTFSITKSQIDFDSPGENLFSKSLVEGYSESQTRVLRLDSDPEIFQLIADYLSGYPILPLSSKSCPTRLGIEKTKSYLIKDAEYLGLKKLEEELLADYDIPECVSDFCKLINLKGGKIVKLNEYFLELRHIPQGYLISLKMNHKKGAELCAAIGSAQTSTFDDIPLTQIEPPYSYENITLRVENRNCDLLMFCSVASGATSVQASDYFYPLFSKDVYSQVKLKKRVFFWVETSYIWFGTNKSSLIPLVAKARFGNNKLLESL